VFVGVGAEVEVKVGVNVYADCVSAIAVETAEVEGAQPESKMIEITIEPKTVKLM
jgi:hypothetical protein